MITNSSYKHIRPAQLSDLQSILRILKSHVQNAAIVLHLSAYIEQQIDNYLVFCKDEDVVGCCEITFYSDSCTAEIASLAVDKFYRNKGIGRKLIQDASEKIVLETTNSHLLSVLSLHMFLLNSYFVK